MIGLLPKVPKFLTPVSVITRNLVSMIHTLSILALLKMFEMTFGKLELGHIKGF